MSCVECSSVPKYKCPICRQPYCSVPCYKRHKAKPCSACTDCTTDATENLPVQSSKTYEYPTEDTVTLDKLKDLAASKEVKCCLENPHVRKMLEDLDKSPRPDILMQEYMQEPIFTEFVDACLHVVEPTEDTT